MSRDFKTKYEHLLHFFEAMTEFISIILLSAFSSNKALFEPHKQTLAAAMLKQNLSFQRATFGAWKLVAENLGKQTREMLKGNDEYQAICRDIFADPSLCLPRALSHQELPSIFSTTNKMRNDWTGHGGVVGPEEAQLRNELLVSQLQHLRDAFSDIWTKTRLIRALHCVPSGGVFGNELMILMGSNSEFIKEMWPMATWLDVERIYLFSQGAPSALKLLPLVQISQSCAILRVQLKETE